MVTPCGLWAGLLQGFEVTDLILKDMPDFDFDFTMHVGDLSYAGIVRRCREPRGCYAVAAADCWRLGLTRGFRSAPTACQDVEISFLNISHNDEWELIWDIWEQQIEPYAGACPRYLTAAVTATV